MPPLPVAFVEYLIHTLMPFFLDIAPDIDTARSEILQTLASYGARTRAEFLNAAQIIACSLSAMDALGEARSPETTLPMRLRLRACANSLNRVRQQNEDTLAKRLLCDPIETAEPPTDIDAEAPKSPDQPKPNRPQAMQERNKHLWAASIRDVLAQMNIPMPPSPVPPNL